MTRWYPLRRTWGTPQTVLDRGNSPWKGQLYPSPRDRTWVTPQERRASACYAADGMSLVEHFLVISLFHYSGSLAMFSTLTEHCCYNLSRGLHTTPEGVTSDITELRKELPMNFIEDLFKFAANVQALKRTEFQEHLLKSVLLFEPSTYSNSWVFHDTRFCQIIWQI